MATVFNGVVFAAGFELPQRGVKEMGMAYAGSAAMLNDASAVANNPAGLLRLQGRQASAGLSLIQSAFDYDVEVRRELVPAAGGTVPGRQSDSIEALSAAPHLYYSRRLTDDAAVGIGLYVPFATLTEYPADWAGRYHATDTVMRAINITPTYAWQQTAQLSFGLGMVLQRFDADFRNSIDLGYLVAEQVIDEVSDATGPFGVDIRLRDGESGVVDALAHNFDVDNIMTVGGWGYGANFGVLWEHDERLRIGLNYASAIRQVADGTAKRRQTTDPAFRQALEDAIRAVRLQANILGVWTNVGTIGSQRPESAVNGAAKAVGPLGAAGGDIQLVVTMPEVITLSAMWQWRDSLALAGGVTWTQWSRIPELRFTYTDSSLRGGEDITGTGDDVRRRDLVQPFDWQDSWRVNAGVEFLRGAWVWRSGVSFDQSPVPNASRRTPRGPDSDRILLAVGGSRAITEKLVLDLAWVHTHFRSSRIDNAENPAGSQHRMTGSYSGRLNTMAAQLNWAF